MNRWRRQTGRSSVLIVAVSLVGLLLLTTMIVGCGGAKATATSSSLASSAYGPCDRVTTIEPGNSCRGGRRSERSECESHGCER